MKGFLRKNIEQRSFDLNGSSLEHELSITLTFGQVVKYPLINFPVFGKDVGFEFCRQYVVKRRRNNFAWLTEDKRTLQQLRCISFSSQYHIISFIKKINLVSITLVNIDLQSAFATMSS